MEARPQTCVGFVGAEQRVDGVRVATGADHRQEPRQIAIGVGTGDHVHQLVRLQQLRLQALRHAAWKENGGQRREEGGGEEERGDCPSAKHRADIFEARHRVHR